MSPLPVLRTAGGSLAAVVVSAWLAIVEVFWLPLRIGGVLLPLSVVGAVVGNLVIGAGARRLAGSGTAAVLAAVTWLVVVVAAMIPRSEGDLLIVGAGDTGIGNIVFLMAGVVSAAYATGRALATGRAGSGTGGAR
ncbi:MAG: hypothetical protein QOJ68_2520 [Blastococcus sp.]|nr:hypothetical protein [Blastococcus sp.]